MTAKHRSVDSDEVLAAEVVAHPGPLLHDADGAPVDPASPASGVSDAGSSGSDDLFTGDTDIRAVLARARHVFVHRPDQLVPVCLTPAEARLFLRRVGGLPDPVVVIARVRGPDLVVRTLQYLGHPVLRTRAAASAPIGGAGSNPSARPGWRDPLRGLGRTVARVGRVTRKRPSRGVIVSAAGVRRAPSHRLPAGVTPLDAPEDTSGI